MVNAGATYQRLPLVAAAAASATTTATLYHPGDVVACTSAVPASAPASTAITRPMLRSRCISSLGRMTSNAAPVAQPTCSRSARNRSLRRWRRRARAGRRTGGSAGRREAWAVRRVPATASRRRTPRPTRDHRPATRRPSRRRCSSARSRATAATGPRAKPARSRGAVVAAPPTKASGTTTLRTYLAPAGSFGQSSNQVSVMRASSPGSRVRSPGVMP